MVELSLKGQHGSGCETYMGLNAETVDWPRNPASSRAAGHSFADKGSMGGR